MTLNIATDNDPIMFAEIEPIYINKSNHIDLSNYLTEYTCNCGISVIVSAIDSKGKYCNSNPSEYTIKEIYTYNPLN